MERASQGESQTRSIEISEDTIEEIRAHTNANTIQDGIQELADKAAYYEDFDRFLLTVFAEKAAVRAQQWYDLWLWYVLGAGFLSLFGFVWGGEYWVLWSATGILLVGGYGAARYVNDLNKLKRVHDNFKEIGVLRDWGEYESLADAETPTEAAYMLREIRSIPDISDADLKAHLQAEATAAPEDEDTPDDAEPTLFLDERAYSQIESLRSTDDIDDGDLADAVFREARIANARKQGPEIELDPEEVLDLVSELNQRVDTGRFVTYSGDGARTRLDYQIANE